LKLDQAIALLDHKIHFRINQSTIEIIQLIFFEAYSKPPKPTTMQVSIKAVAALTGLLSFSAGVYGVSFLFAPFTSSCCPHFYSHVSH